MIVYEDMHGGRVKMPKLTIKGKLARIFSDRFCYLYRMLVVVKRTKNSFFVSINNPGKQYTVSQFHHDTYNHLVIKERRLTALMVKKGLVR